MIRPPFLNQGLAAKRSTPSWLAIILGTSTFYIASAIAVLFLSPILNRWNPTFVEGGRFENSIFKKYALLDMTLIHLNGGIIITLLVVAWISFYEGRSIQSLGLRLKSWPLLIKGFSGGILAASLVAFFAVFLTGADVSLTATDFQLPEILVMFVLVPLALGCLTFGEEVVLRGFVFQSIGYHHGIVIAAIGTAVLLSALRYGAGMPFIFFFVSIFVFNFFQCIYAVVENSLWGPIGFHTGWRFASAALLGILVIDADDKEIRAANMMKNIPHLLEVETNVAVYSIASLVVFILMLILLFMLSLQKRDMYR